MKLNCQPGDLAVIVRYFKVPQPDQIGLMVIVEEFFCGESVRVDGLFYPAVNAPCWIVRSAIAGALLPMVKSNGSIGMYSKILVADMRLKPIRGLPKQEEVKDKELELS